MSIRGALAVLAGCSLLACTYGKRPTSSALAGTYEFSGAVARCGSVAGTFQVNSGGSVAAFSVPTPSGFRDSGCSIRRLAISRQDGSSVHSVQAIVQVAEAPAAERNKPGSQTTFRRFPVILSASRSE